MSYKLRSVLRGHELDVRAVCPAVFPEGGIITASRDRTARLWIPSEGNLGFEEGHVLSGHNNFISAVCTIPPTDKYQHGTSSMFLKKQKLISLNSDETTVLKASKDNHVQPSSVHPFMTQRKWPNL